VEEVPFVVARVLLQDFTGVPLLVDLAAMRSAAVRLGKDPKRIEPLVPVDLVIDHSVQVDHFGTKQAFEQNLDVEFERNQQRYEFLKWGMSAFDTFRIVPPGVGICHQVNLEFLAQGVREKDGVYFPDTLVGTDSHTTMINGVGVVGWGVGGIEAEAAMLGQPVYFLTPDVVGLHLKGTLKPGVTATDLVLSVTELLRKAKVVGKFVEFHGEGAASLAVAERATLANMAPEYGATMGFFPVDENTCRYLASTGRSPEAVDLVRRYYTAQGMFGIPKAGECNYSQVLELDLGSVVPCVAGPKRPQDRIPLVDLGTRFKELLAAPSPNGYGKQGEARVAKAEIAGETLTHGDVVIAAITSCTNTSNPSVMLAAGLLAKRAIHRGLKVKKTVKTSLAPGSRVVTDYLARTGLQQYLDELGFNLVGYGCTTCIGNSGPLAPEIEDAIVRQDLVTASVLSGNRNFEARVHQSVKANFLMSPPLVVAFAIAGRVDIDLATQPLGKGKTGEDVFLKDIWPTPQEVAAVLESANDPATYRKLYGDLENASKHWQNVKSPTGVTYAWDQASTYIQEPPYFADFQLEARGGTQAPVTNARALALFGDSITTDHISPAGSIKPSSPAGKWLQAHGVTPRDFNSYGARRGSHDVMVRGTFANVRIKNLMVPGVEGGVTKKQPEGTDATIYDAAMDYAKEGTALVILGGHEYGTGSSRDWAAKGTRLLGVRAVTTRSFERIHRSNLVGMGVLPCQFADAATSVESLGLDGTESYDLVMPAGAIKPRQAAVLKITRKAGEVLEVPVIVRIDTPIEVEYYEAGGILPYVLRQLLTR
jgi:aconitate hydratase